jgi:asparagine synthase (glutamine-hydrolysing)
MLNNTNGDFGVLLSGGLDSSLIASLVVKIAKERGDIGSGKRIKTFSIGINKNSPDLIAAREVAQFLQTDHYEYYYSVQEGIDNIKNVIWYIESYDCTSVRASTAMYMLTKQIKRNFPNIKVLYSGELSDELLCYLYGANAPNDDAFQDETVHLVSNVHYFDCLRANKTCMAHGLEVRVPFTDKEYVKYILSLHPKYKRFGPINGYIEKKIVRDSFVGYIPDTILQRKKEQFSDGVSDFNKENNWIDNLKKYTDSMYTDDMFNELKTCFPYNTPVTKEHLFYREIFCTLFNSYNNNTSELTVKSWLPKWSKNIDPSGRIQSFYN